MSVVSPDTPVSSIIKSNRRNKTEILLKVQLNIHRQKYTKERGMGINFY